MPSFNFCESYEIHKIRKIKRLEILVIGEFAIANSPITRISSLLISPSWAY